MILVYGADWCNDCRMVKNWLTAHGGPWEYRDIERDPEALARAIEISGARSIPVVVWPDDSFLVEPSIQELTAAHARGSANPEPTAP